MKTVALIFALLSSPAFAAVILVNGNANIFGAGHATPPAPADGHAGTLPPSFTLGIGNTLTFSASGLVTYNGGGNFYGPDGGLFGPTNMSSIGGISGIQHGTLRMFLAGVFTDGTEPSGGGPPVLDFSNDAFPSVSPLLNQTFFVGDGLTGNGSGSVQQFYAPAGATKLFLGFADGIDFTGLPGTYSDNSGTLTVVVNQVPELSSLALLGVGLVRLASRRNRKRL